MGYYFKTSDLSVGYDGNVLIHDINIEIEKGEILSLIGPNGAGKSTILKSITKHLEMISGDAQIADASVKHMSFRELAKKVSVVLTERIKGELMTCYDVVATGRYPYTNSLGILSEEDREKVYAAMERVHASDLAGRDFHSISDGQRQRILLARAICQEPEIIVLDEPTSFLDIKHKLELLSILRSMSKEKGITVIMSLHEIDLAQKISDKVMCVKGETISNFGTPEDIFKTEIITDLYGMEKGSYNIAFGSVELPRPEGQARTFVIASCGNGINVFRRLQKEEKPFYAGIIYENDIDYHVAKYLAQEVVSVPAFTETTEDDFRRAAALMDKCDEVICAGFPKGARILERLEEKARADGKLKGPAASK
ncbi:MAG: ABC transporter ATP-binding protein [Firmicutes bacterium]|nr:ABC transporter ATP-binding protein [Bacillota bacterium]